MCIVWVDLVRGHHFGSVVDIVVFSAVAEFVSSADCTCAQNRIYLGMTTIKDLIIKRPNSKLDFLDILLNFTCHDKAEVGLLAVIFRLFFMFCTVYLKFVFEACIEHALLFMSYCCVAYIATKHWIVIVGMTETTVKTQLQCYN